MTLHRALLKIKNRGRQIKKKILTEYLKHFHRHKRSWRFYATFTAKTLIGDTQKEIVKDTCHLYVIFKCNYCTY